MKILNIFISEVEDENEGEGYDTLEEAIKKAEGETTGKVICDMLKLQKLDKCTTIEVTNEVQFTVSGVTLTFPIEFVVEKRNGKYYHKE